MPHCDGCGNKFIRNPIIDVDNLEQCCLCWYPELIALRAPDEVFREIFYEVRDLLDGVEGEFERIGAMVQATEEECDYSYDISKCGPDCAYHETCPWNNIYTLPPEGRNICRTIQSVRTR